MQENRCHGSLVGQDPAQRTGQDRKVGTFNFYRKANKRHQSSGVEFQNGWVEVAITISFDMVHYQRELNQLGMCLKTQPIKYHALFLLFIKFSYKNWGSINNGKLKWY
ncbi:phospholipase D1 [Platysternon megacephalum]|uniref:Phospholipase D1 n=1 Tax=Platysternon megacephalum TaxID=55544 RepID=A0A4D9F163_9SAUR|nr:phospholipase D1 [Platysternon megacephalum]